MAFKHLGPTFEPSTVLDIYSSVLWSEKAPQIKPLRERGSAQMRIYRTTTNSNSANSRIELCSTQMMLSSVNNKRRGKTQSACTRDGWTVSASDPNKAVKHTRFTAKHSTSVINIIHCRLRECATLKQQSRNLGTTLKRSAASCGRRKRQCRPTVLSCGR